MSFEEKTRLLLASRQNHEWMTARLAMELALNTTMRGCELKSLRWRDVELMNRIFTVIKSKTDAGERVIPMNGDAFEAVLALRERAKFFGEVEADHFIFPACENGRIDPTRPQRSWRTAWRQLTKAAGLKGLRFHDLRHHAITELAESQASDSTIMAIAGHVDPKMLAHYSHVHLKRNGLHWTRSRVEAEREVMAQTTTQIWNLRGCRARK